LPEVGETVELFERITRDGTLKFFAKGGSYANFKIKRMILDGEAQDTCEIPNARSITIYLKTFKVIKLEEA
jgi:hypothetical protein